jgi:hypothetical protein
MYAARVVVVFFLILTVLVAYNPQVREDVTQFWEEIRPGVVEFMDHFYAVVRDLINGNETHEPVDETPDPGANFLRIVT